MSGRCLGWAWDQDVGNPLRKLVLVHLADCSNQEGESWWTQPKIAKACNTSRQTVNGHIDALRGMGLVQVVEQRHDNGGRKGNLYRLIGPWSETPVKEDDRGGVKEGDSLNQELEEPRSKDLAAGAAREPEYLGQKRWRVFSRPGRGPFTVDLNAGTCSCENRTATQCRHQAVALEAARRADVARRRELRDAVWDVLAEIFGPPTSKGSADRGLIVTDIAEMLVNDKVEQTADLWQAEVRRRYEALAHDWGVGKATIRALHKNWVVAGKLAHGVVGSRSGKDGGDVFDQYG